MAARARRHTQDPALAAGSDQSALPHPDHDVFVTARMTSQRVTAGNEKAPMISWPRPWQGSQK